jgi:aromatic ring-opening dioxygenase LigB subunit
MMLPEAEIRIGKGIKAWDKRVYPIVEVSLLKTDAGGVQAGRIVPLAVLVVEPEEQYVLSLTGEKISAQMLQHLAPALREVVEKARGVRRINLA